MMPAVQFTRFHGKSAWQAIFLQVAFTVLLLAPIMTTAAERVHFNRDIGSATASAVKTRTCPPTSFSPPSSADAPLTNLPTTASGAAAFCPPSTAALSSATRATPSSTCPIPPGMDRALRRDSLDQLSALNQHRFQQIAAPEIEARIAQYEMAFLMQPSAPDLTDTTKEPAAVLDLYGPDVKRTGSYAANCLLARRLAERNVRFIQFFHMGWDHHGGLPKAIKGRCQDTDQATAGLIKDLKQRGLLDDTLIVWGGEFGRTIYSQGTLTETNYGREHHPRCFTLFLAGGGVKPGFTLGETDDFCYNIIKDPVSIFDLHAAMPHLMGIDHNRLTHKFQGLAARLTGAEGAKVLKAIANP
jgi:hypothetical protein